MIAEMIAMLTLTFSTMPKEQPDVIDLIPIVAEAPAPEQMPEPNEDIIVVSHKLNQDEVRILARLLWSSPLRANSEKRKLLWVVFNRIYKEPETFGDTVTKAVNTSEFSFYDRHAHISDRNMEIAEHTWNEYLSMREGYYIGKHPSNGMRYISFSGENNNTVELRLDK